MRQKAATASKIFAEVQSTSCECAKTGVCLQQPSDGYLKMVSDVVRVSVSGKMFVFVYNNLRI